jgi:hypothetical protein
MAMGAPLGIDNGFQKSLMINEQSLQFEISTLNQEKKLLTNRIEMQ